MFFFTNKISKIFEIKKHLSRALLTDIRLMVKGLPGTSILTDYEH